MNNRLITDYKKEVIESSINHIPYPVFEGDFIYNLRYSKKEEYGLEKLWQKATHIVTTNQHYQTETGNLNFVFSTSKGKQEQWNYLYLILPCVLFYAFQVCCSVYYGGIAENERIADDRWERAITGFILSSRNSSDSSQKDYLRGLNAGSKGTTIKCSKCNKAIQYTEKLEKQILFKGQYSCDEGHKNEFFELP